MSQLIATEKITVYKIEAASELAQLFLELKYQNSDINIYNSDEFEEYQYTDEVQDEFNEIYDIIEAYLDNNKL